MFKTWPAQLGLGLCLSLPQSIQAEDSIFSWNPFQKKYQYFVMIEDLPPFLDLFDKVQPDLYMTLGDELFMLDPKDGLPDFKWLQPYLIESHRDSLDLKKQYQTWQQNVSHIDNKRRFTYVEVFFESLKDKLYQSTQRFTPWKLDLGLTLQHDSNVTQSPDNQAGASEETGFSYQPDIALGYHFKEIDNRRHFIGLDAGLTDYTDSSLEPRESQYLSLKTHVEFNLKHTKYFHSFKPEFRYRNDWLDNAGSKEIGFATTSLAFQLMAKPRQKPFSLSDVFIPLGILSFDFRDYKNFLSTSAAGNSRDTFSPSLTFMGINIKKHQELTHRSTAMLYFNTPSADDPDQEYFALRFSFNHMIGKDLWEVGPEIAYSFRDQDDYNGSTRQDDAFEIELKGNYRYKENVKLGAELGFKRQLSDQASFDYDNTYVAFTTEWNPNLYR